jgi:hypothetical protein
VFDSATDLHVRARYDGLSRLWEKVSVNSTIPWLRSFGGSGGTH